MCRPARTDRLFPQGPAAAAGTLWVNRQAPFRAIYRTPAATFTYVSELPEEQADDGVGALVRSRPGHTAPAPAGTGSRPGWSAAWSGLWSCSRAEFPLPGRGTAGMSGIVAGTSERVIFLECLESTDRSSFFC